MRMDHFEWIVSKLLEDRGYWTRIGVRVELTKSQKRSIGKPSMPRPEVDVVAFKPKRNELVLFEVKSFLDSPGVKLKGLRGVRDGRPSRFKLLVDERYQRLVRDGVVRRFRELGLLRADPTVRMGLAAGNVPVGERDAVREFCAEREWEYLSPDEIAEWVEGLADRAYENSPIVLASKLIVRRRRREA